MPGTRPSSTVDQTALQRALGRVGDRWSLLLVDALLDGPRRYNDLHGALPGVATNVLSQRLKHLEAERIVIGRPYSTRPRRFAYELTAAGRQLAGALRLLAGWGADNLGPEGFGDVSGTPEHGACGTPLEVCWHCPTCDVAVDADTALAVQYI